MIGLNLSFVALIVIESTNFEQILILQPFCILLTPSETQFTIQREEEVLLLTLVKLEKQNYSAENKKFGTGESRVSSLESPNSTQKSMFGRKRTLHGREDKPEKQKFSNC